MAARSNRRDVHRFDRDRFKTEINEREIDQSLHMEQYQYIILKQNTPTNRMYFIRT